MIQMTVYDGLRVLNAFDVLAHCIALSYGSGENGRRRVSPAECMALQSLRLLR